jgi:hypothetical protein
METMAVRDHRKQKRAVRDHRKQKRQRGPSKFKRSDIARAVKATIASGLTVAGIKVDPHSGEFSVIVGEPASTTDPNPWDEVTNAADKKRPA